MELRSLRYFVVLAEELNITHAAERLHMSQPPLSHQLQQLEDELGATLFIRGKRRMTLTDEGELLLRRARELLELEERTAGEIRAMREGISGTLYLSLVEGRAPYLAARWITGFREEYPNVHCSLWNGSSDDVTERLEKGLADAAVIALPFDTEHLDGIEVGSEPWVAIIPRTHPLAALPGNELELSQLKDQPLIVPARRSRMESIRGWFEEAGTEPSFVCTTSNYLDAVALTEQGAGISIFPQTTYTPNDMTVTRVIAEPRREIEYVLAWKRDCRLNAITQAFIDYVRDFMEQDSIHSERFRVKERS